MAITDTESDGLLEVALDFEICRGARCNIVLDEKTRFLIANEITEQRSTLETRMVMQKAKKQTKNAKPWVMISDGMSAYPSAIRQEFGDDTPTHRQRGHPRPDKQQRAGTLSWHV